jgi:hypothetical protein
MKHILFYTGYAENRHKTIANYNSLLNLMKGDRDPEMEEVEEGFIEDRDRDSGRYQS